MFSIDLLLRRVLRCLVTLWLVVTVVFVASRLSGDPLYHLVPPSTPDEQREMLRHQLGLDESLPRQYLRYLSDIAGGDFGVSFFARRPVAEVYAERLPATLQLMLPSFVLAVIFGVGLGLAGAVFRGRPIDTALRIVALLGQTTPNFLLGLGLILLFSLWLRLLPSGGTGSIGHAIMPVLVLAIGLGAAVLRLTRASMLDVLGQFYVSVARGKGLTPLAVLMRHALPNALLPVVTLIGLQIGTLIGGATIVETVFAWPGAGRLLVGAVLQRDFPLLQFGVLVVAATVTLANLLVDLSYSLLDPRLDGYRA
jgi:peptide/nickel transport system permease protein